MAQVLHLTSKLTYTGNPDKEAEAFLYQVRMEAYDWDVEALAHRAGVSKYTIYAFRSGRTKWPRPNTLFSILNVLGYKMFIQKVR